MPQARAIICFGQAGPEIAGALAGLPLTEVHTLASAVETAAGLAEDGDVVLLSPACASFDQFSNYSERGNLFKKLVAD